MARYTFYTAQDYYRELINKVHAARAGDRVVLASLFVHPDEELIAKLFGELRAAAKRNVKVVVIVDAFTFLIKRGVAPGPAYFLGPNPQWMPPIFAARMKALQDVKAAGGDYAVINQPARALAVPFRGRSHIKFSVVSDHVFIGGCNLGETANTDLMVTWRDKRIADWLDDFSRQLLQTGSVREVLGDSDVTLPIDNTTSLLVDAGVPGQSVVLDRAYELIDAAKRQLIITLQYFPHGETAKHLASALGRKVDVRTYYNHPGRHSLPLNVVFGSEELRARKGMPPALWQYRLGRQQPYLHAKLVAHERAALLSSHNYMTQGVAWGTAEIGLFSTDPDFVAGATKCMKQQLRQTSKPQ